MRRPRFDISRSARCEGESAEDGYKVILGHLLPMAQRHLEIAVELARNMIDENFHSPTPQQQMRARLHGRYLPLPPSAKARRAAELWQQ
jgi:hypothetical protein